MSSLRRSASASASASRRASATNRSDRTSGTHTCTGRYPRSRMRRRYSPARCVDVPIPQLLHETCVACNIGNKFHRASGAVVAGSRRYSRLSRDTHTNVVAGSRRYSRLSRDTHTNVVAGSRRYSRLSRDTHTNVVAGSRRYSRLSRDTHTNVVAGSRRYSRLSRDSTNRSNSSHAWTASAYGGAGLLTESESRT